MVLLACAIAWLVTPRARALAWSTSSLITLTDSFQLSLTPRVLGLARRMALTSSARARNTCGSVPTTRNCTGYGTGGPLGRSLARERASGNSVASSSGNCLRRRSRAAMSLGNTTIWLTFVCGKIWSSTNAKRSTPEPTQVVT